MYMHVHVHLYISLSCQVMIDAVTVEPLTQSGYLLIWVCSCVFIVLVAIENSVYSTRGYGPLNSTHLKPQSYWYDTNKKKKILF